MDITDKVALVTGGGRGIGRGIALVMARNGADVAVVDLHVDDADSVAAEITALGRTAVAVEADIADQASVDSMVHSVVDRFGRIDILVNNAGVIAAPGWESRDMPSDEDWDLIMAINVRGLARVTETVAPHMKRQRYGKIVNIASIAGRLGSSTSSPYSASKAAVISMTQTAAVDLDELIGTIRERESELEPVDAELLVDGHTAVVYCLGDVGPESERLAVEFSKQSGCDVRLQPMFDPEPGGCGSGGGGCGSGGCGSK